MAHVVLSNFSSALVISSKYKASSLITTPLPPPPPPSSPVASTASPQTKLEPPPPQRRVSHADQTPAGPNKNSDPRSDFYVNLGTAVRTLREDVPLIFSKDLNYDIYRDDITFSDPLNTFAGIENYRLIFWALRFHGRVLFKEISLDVLRIWQPSENEILIRWNLFGVPRVPWEAMGQFQGTSRYKLDRNGKIYEHKVDNLAFNFPQTLRPAASALGLGASCPASPNPTFLWAGPVDRGACSWVEFYRAVIEALDRRDGSAMAQDCLAVCSW